MSQAPVARPVVSGVHRENCCRQGRGQVILPHQEGQPSAGLPRARQTRAQRREASGWSPVLRGTGAARPGEEKTQGDLTNVHKYLQRGCKEDGSRLSPGVPSDRGNGHTLKHRRFPLNIRKFLFPLRVTEHCHRLPREVTVFPSLEILKKLYGSDPGLPALGGPAKAVVGPDDTQRSLPAITIQPPCEFHRSYFVHCYTLHTPAMYQDKELKVSIQYLSMLVLFYFSAPPTHPAGNEILKRGC